MAAGERVHVKNAVTEDTAEALAYLVEPFDLVSDVPGVDVARASWSSEHIDYDPDSPERGFDQDDDGEGEEGDWRG